MDLEQDIWAARELHKRGKLSLREWWQSLAGKKVDAIYAPDDIRPFAGYLFGLMNARAIQLWGRLRHPMQSPQGAMESGPVRAKA